MIERLKLIEKRYDEINNLLMDPSIVCDINKSRELSKELSSIEDIVNVFHTYQKVLSDILEAKEMTKDVELAEYAYEEIENLNKQQENLENQLQIMLIPKDKNDGKNVIVEIRGAAGGDEANIFAGDLFDMYEHLATKKGWKIEILESESGVAGGYTLISFMVKGDNVYSYLKYESGSHRVQRVPVTETQGRIQTSTATVLVMPEPDPLDCTLNMDEIRIDITRSSGCGGQGVNTTDSAVRLTHIPTGIVVYSQTERSQIKNKEKGLKILEARIYDLKNRERDQELGNERRSKIGTGDRSEKIRTYNYPQNRVTDHRIGYTTSNLDRVMTGDIDKVIDALIAEDQARKLRGDNE